MAKRRRRHNKVSKREQEVQRRRESMDQMRRLIIPAALIIIIAFAVMLALRWDGGDGLQPTDPVNVNDNNQVEILSSEITSTARYYSYDAKGTEVRFFAVRGSDGNVRVALDACDVCYGANKGYVQSGNAMKCNNCGNEYDTDGIGTKNLQGGCWPSYIPIQEVDGKVMIKTQDLQAKAFMF